MEMAVTDQPSYNQNQFGFPQQQKGPGGIQGLEPLMHLKEFKVKQHWPGCIELLDCFELKNKYSLLDEVGNKIFFMVEESGCCDRYWCANAREFTMRITDSQDREVLTFQRPLRCIDCCCKCCYPSCTQELTVYSGDVYLGKVVEKPTWWTKHFEVWNERDEQVFDISGPCCPCSCCDDVIFPIHNLSGVDVGDIRKVWMGCGKEAFTDMDNFKVEFPVETDVAHKALLLGATMLIDFMFFEKQNNNNN